MKNQNLKNLIIYTENFMIYREEKKKDIATII